MKHLTSFWKYYFRTGLEVIFNNKIHGSHSTSVELIIHINTKLLYLLLDGTHLTCNHNTRNLEDERKKLCSKKGSLSQSNDAANTSHKVALIHAHKTNVNTSGKQKQPRLKYWEPISCYLITHWVHTYLSFLIIYWHEKPGKLWEWPNKRAVEIASHLSLWKHNSIITWTAFSE